MADLLDPDAVPAALAMMFATRKSQPDLLAGVDDDDCAVLRWEHPFLVVTTDYVNANPIALEFGVGDQSTIGRLVVAANLADILGTGAVPVCLLLSVVMPRDADATEFQALVNGARAEAERWSVPIVGGDTKLGSALAVCGTAIGAADHEAGLFLKYRARPGDAIWSSGNLGSCSAAVLGMAHRIPDENFTSWAVNVLTSPNLPIAQSRAVSELRLSSGGTDISDGLGTDLAQMCAASGVGATVDLQEIPIHPQAASIGGRLGLPPWAFAFGIGGEFQFIVTAPSAATDAMARLGLSRIGTVTASLDLLVRRCDGRIRELPRGGHRDGRRMSFASEVSKLVHEARDVVE